jgi:hypothetical protein
LDTFHTFPLVIQPGLLSVTDKEDKFNANIKKKTLALIEAFFNQNLKLEEFKMASKHLLINPSFG